VGRASWSIGEKKGEAYDQIDGFAFNAAGRIPMPRGWTTGVVSWLETRRELKPFTPKPLILPVFSPDGGTVVYTASDPDVLADIVVGDKRGEHFKEIGMPVFSSDGKTLAYPARNSRSGASWSGDAKGVRNSMSWDARVQPGRQDGRLRGTGRGTALLVSEARKSEEVDLIPARPARRPIRGRLMSGRPQDRLRRTEGTG
jgi:hypothetical protein